MNQSEVAALMQQSMQSDMQAFRSLVMLLQGGVYGLAFRLLGNESEAEDVTQECFIRLWQNLHKLDPERSLAIWLSTVASRLCFDRMKAFRRRNALSVEVGFESLCLSSENPEQQLTDREFKQLVQVLASELSPMQQLVFTLRCLEERDADEVAEITGLTQAKIKSNLYQARQVLMKKLKNYPL